MKRSSVLTVAALLAAVPVAAAMIDAAAILSRPVRPYFAWMLP